MSQENTIFLTEFNR